MASKKRMISALRYYHHRMETLTELQALVYNRSQLNKEIRALQRELNGWDIALLKDYEEKLAKENEGRAHDANKRPALP